MTAQLKPHNAEWFAAMGITGKNRAQRRQQQAVMHGTKPARRSASWRRIKKAWDKRQTGDPLSPGEAELAAHLITE